jgi:hypothetical protein
LAHVLPPRKPGEPIASDPNRPAVKGSRRRSRTPRRTG